MLLRGRTGKSGSISLPSGCSPCELNVPERSDGVLPGLSIVGNNCVLLEVGGARCCSTIPAPLPVLTVVFLLTSAVIQRQCAGVKRLTRRRWQQCRRRFDFAAERASGQSDVPAL